MLRVITRQCWCTVEGGWCEIDEKSLASNTAVLVGLLTRRLPSMYEGHLGTFRLFSLQLVMEKVLLQFSEFNVTFLI